MNKTIETILSHRSIRNFDDRPLSEGQIQTIVACAQSASTSSFIQAYSIIGIKKRETKEKLAEIAGNQTYVQNNGHLFVFCADLYRHELIGEMEKADISTSLESTEKFMVMLIDTALAAQNAMIAAESMGLGGCFIGGLRNNLKKVCELLEVPKRVLPLFALTIGYPAKISGQKPRLPFRHVYHEDAYEQDKEKYIQQLMEYNETISQYYKNRTNGVRLETWTEQMANMLSNPKRMYMKKFVEEKNFNLK